jgi:hypothetical protein
MAKTEKDQVVDIQNIRAMSPEDYVAYLQSIIHVDHHDVLRSLVDGQPLAVTNSQAKLLMAYLKELEPQVGEESVGRE